MNFRKFYLVPVFLFYGIIGCLAQETTSDVKSVSVNDFGAMGDSITDDTRPIQEAVRSNIGQIVFESGRYRITSTIDIDLDKVGKISLNGLGTATIIMDGAGPAFRFTGTHEGTASPATVNYDVWKDQRMPLVDGLEIVGAHPESEGIEAIGTMKLTVTRILVREALNGIHLTGRNRNVVISDCHIYNNRGIGIYLDDVDVHQINITSCHVSYNRKGGIVVRNGSVRNIQIGTCDIEANMDVNGPPSANIFIDESEGTMREGAIVGCTIQHDANSPGSANIRVVGHASDKLRKTGNFTIADNHLSDTQYNIHIQHGRAIIITGNTFNRGAVHNLLIQESDNIHVGPNLMDNNPDYGITGNKDMVNIQESSNLTLTGLHINNSYSEPAAVVLDRCRNYNLTNSTILNCRNAGILLKNTENGKVSGNAVISDISVKPYPVSIKVLGGKRNFIITNYTGGVIKGDAGSAEILDNYVSPEE